MLKTKLHRRYVLIGLTAAVCFVLSIYYELVIAGELSGPVQTSEKVLEALESFTRELGFALIIALMISIGIEAHSRNEDLKLAVTLRSEIALDVFKGVFSRRLPPDYVDRVVERHLYPHLIRSGFTAALRLRPITPEELSAWNMPADQFAILESVYEFELENISTGAFEHEINFFIPSRGGPWSDVSKLVYLVAGEQPIGLVNGIEAEASQTNFSFKIPLDPGQRIPVRLKTEVLKEISDSEVWTCLIPTLTPTISFTNEIEGSALGIRSTGPAPLFMSQQLPNERWLCTFEKPMLQGESIVFWWRTADP